MARRKTTSVRRKKGLRPAQPATRGKRIVSQPPAVLPNKRSEKKPAQQKIEDVPAESGWLETLARISRIVQWIVVIIVPSICLVYMVTLATYRFYSRGFDHVPFEEDTVVGQHRRVEFLLAKPFLPDFSSLWFKAKYQLGMVYY